MDILAYSRCISSRQIGGIIQCVSVTGTGGVVVGTRGLCSQVLLHENLVVCTYLRYKNTMLH